VNSYNAGDCTLNFIWYSSQLTKPYAGLEFGANELNEADRFADTIPFPVDISAGVANWLTRDHRNDNHDRQYWADFNVDYNREIQSVFPDASDSVSINRDKNLIRQWAEVGFWFPSLAGPIGSSSNAAIFGAITEADPDPTTWDTINLTPYGAVKGDPQYGPTCSSDLVKSANPWSPTFSHSYMPADPFPRVWPGFKLYRSVITDGIADPDQTPPQ
jgi:hypothetical protein